MERRSVLPIAAASLLAASIVSDFSFAPPVRIPRAALDTYKPILHPTKGWRGVKKKHRAKFKRRRRKS